jgi:DNA-binding NtrC family response regulator
MMESARICLIDEDIYVRNSLALGLREAGYVVSAAPGAVAGLDFVRRHGDDATITDMRMPDTDGAELIAQARAAWPLLPSSRSRALALSTGAMSPTSSASVGPTACSSSHFGFMS